MVLFSTPRKSEHLTSGETTYFSTCISTCFSLSKRFWCFFKKINIAQFTKYKYHKNFYTKIENSDYTHVSGFVPSAYMLSFYISKNLFMKKMEAERLNNFLKVTHLSANWNPIPSILVSESILTTVLSCLLNAISSRRQLLEWVQLCIKSISQWFLQWMKYTAYLMFIVLMHLWSGHVSASIL